MYVFARWVFSMIINQIFAQVIRNKIFLFKDKI
jgi:hypothetical protein